MSDPLDSPRRLLSDDLFDRMTELLEVSDPAAADDLRKGVEAALQEFAAQREAPSPTPKELRQTFDHLYLRATDLHDALSRLGAYERNVLDEASLDAPNARLAVEGVFGGNEAIHAVRRIRSAIRAGKLRLPAVKRGPQVDRVRWFFVHRVGVCFWRARGGEMPTRRHDAYQESDYGPFRDFVILAHQALGLSDQGVDDVIRKVWGNMGKKRPSGT